MKYIFIDTSIYIRCCQSYELDVDISVLKKLKVKLDNGDTVLLLPEVVQLEFERQIPEKVEELKKAFEEVENNCESSIKYPKAKRDLIEEVDKFKSDIEKKFDEVCKYLLNKIFVSKRTVKIPISNDIILSAYKRGLLGKKPYRHPEFKLPGASKEYTKNPGPTIQADCVSTESLIEFLKDKKNYTLLFCCGDLKDFAVSKTDETIHDDLKNDFERVVFYKQLHELLNKEFGAKIEEKELTITKNPSLGLIDNLKPYSNVINGTAISPMANGYNVLNGNPVIMQERPTILSASIGNLFTNECNGCGKLYNLSMSSIGYSGIDVGLCDLCKIQGRSF